MQSVVKDESDFVSNVDTKSDIDVLAYLPIAGAYHAEPIMVSKGVWRWRHKPTNAWHKLKLRSDKGGRYLLANENHVLGRLKSQYAPEVYGCYDFEQDRILVSGYAKGNTLAALIREQGHAFNGYQYFVSSLIDSLVECHRSDVVHNDIKPNNIIYDGKDMRLIDFGLSLSIGADIGQLPFRGYRHSYSLPALKEGKGQASTDMDWYACLVVLFVTIYGQLPSVCWKKEQPILSAFSGMLEDAAFSKLYRQFLMLRITELDENLNI